MGEEGEAGTTPPLFHSMLEKEKGGRRAKRVKEEVEIWFKLLSGGERGAQVGMCRKRKGKSHAIRFPRFPDPERKTRPKQTFFPFSLGKRRRAAN